LTNLCFIDQQPREKIPAYIRASDVCLVLLRKTELFKTVIPTKMLEFMACARPVILGVDGQARKILDEAQAGLFMEPENSAALVQAILRLAADPALRESFGRNGLRHILQHFSRQQTADDYLTVLQDVVNEGQARRRL
jgi:glycosyltransferase involved in cell wall biosynthesis